MVYCSGEAKKKIGILWVHVPSNSRAIPSFVHLLGVGMTNSDAENTISGILKQYYFFKN